MNIFLKSLSLLIFMSLCSPVFAGSIVQTRITFIDVRNDGTFLITTSQDINANPGCVTVLNRMTANTNTLGGKAILSAAYVAQAGNKFVELQGTDDCRDYSGIESIHRLVISSP